MSYSLSLCIPTYNFGKFIGATLESIIFQATSEVEIIVLDGASTDNTSDVVKNFQINRPNLKYFQLSKKGGIDHDIAKSIEMASGDYCWLFSADDVLKKGSIKKILDQIKSDHDLYLCKHTNCTFDMKLRNVHPVLNLNNETEFNLSDPRQRQRYFELAQNTEAFFSFMGSIIIKKSIWDSVLFDEEFNGSCWGHVTRIFNVMKTKLNLKYLPEPFLDRRGGNDSFSNKGVVNRFRIGIEGYHRIGDVFFGHNSLEASHIRRTLRNEYSLILFLEAKLICFENQDVEDISMLDHLFFKTYSNFSLVTILKLCIYTSAPKWLLKVAKYIKRKLIKKPKP